ncbi:hypothetical protein ASPSYDRAFT_533281 [Aspergillus sydowii CBS 593.65]|uniref:Secreted protein n=1 Tax=Aspergillus sydowii CBS 593.65 TaxID=1036612 RepID=A0A1L9T2C0_9EURO|nr:uncharacterized protein ASPSYDRAFT_533281 [Aspergillus sydowii CBS 593.65]OJJ53586.1 hypothetical protein ASPSYDRAFT_533281 [Aspergillus sydowii CBS 593.65]
MSPFLASLFLVLYALMVYGLPAEHGSVRDDQLVEPSWEVAPYPGAAPITLNGTVEQVYAKLLEINPNYDEDFKDSEPELEPTRSLKKRKDTLVCDGEHSADTTRIDQGIKYLRKVKGSPQLSPWACSRVSCSWYSAIIWCNDSPYSKTLPSFNNIADGAQVIRDGCNENGYVKGWLDHSDRWRAIVQNADC